MRIAGIDPGNKGAIAIVDFNGPRIVGVDVFRFGKIDLTNAAHVRSVYMYLLGNNISQVYLERINPFGAGRKAWKVLGMWFGTLYTASIAAGHAPVLISAAKWQKELDCLTGGDKNISKAAAQKRFGKHVKIIHDNADALLIAYYGYKEYHRRVKSARSRSKRSDTGHPETPW